MVINEVQRETDSICECGHWISKDWKWCPRCAKEQPTVDGYSVSPGNPYKLYQSIHCSKRI